MDSVHAANVGFSGQSMSKLGCLSIDQTNGDPFMLEELQNSLAFLVATSSLAKLVNFNKGD